MGGLTIAAGLAAALLAGTVRGAETVAAPAPERQREIVSLLRQDCGSCHGMTLQGGLGPPLSAQALAGKAAGALRTTITDGRPGTPMAPWRPFLNEVEAAWLVERLLAGDFDAP